MNPARALLCIAPLLLLPGCPSVDPELPVDLEDDPERYVAEAPYRRAILERDLTTTANRYADRRLRLYGLGTEGWDALPAVDRPSRALTVADVERLAADEPLERGALTTLSPEIWPEDDAAWVALGRRVFFDYPLRADSTYRALATLGVSALDDVGFLRDATGEGFVGLRVFEDDAGALQVGNSCAQCHASWDGRAAPTLDGVLSNRSMDIGAARLLTLGFEPGDLPPELESTAIGELDLLGPGRGDVLPDGQFNPYAFPDFGGLGDLPYLHHNANWHHRQTATLAVRCETLFVTASSERTRIPRELSWALATWQRALPPPEPENEPDDASARGEQVFLAAACDGCHAPPLYTSDRRVTVEEVGTDPSAGESEARWSGAYRIPSLRGVSRTAPYLHHGAIPDLATFFAPERSEPGHPFGLELSAEERADLIAFLRTI